MSDISGAGAHVNITATSAGFAEVNAALERMQAQLTAVQTRLKASVSSGVMAENTYKGIAASLEAASVAAQSYAKTVGASAVAQEGAAASAAEAVAALQAEAAALEAASLSSNKLAFGMKGVTSANKASRSEVAAWKASMVGGIRSVEDSTGRLRKVTAGMQAANFGDLTKNMGSVNSALASTNRSGIATIDTIRTLKTGQQTLFSSSLTGWQSMQMRVTAFKSNLTSMFTTMRNGFKNTQWIGRQLMMGISVPLAAIAAGAIYTFTKVNQAQGRLQKLTTVTGESIDDANARLEAMIPTIRRIGHEFGQMESITTNVMGDWASMGFQGDALTEVTELTSQFALLGSIDLSDSTDFVRKIYATFGDSNMQKTRDLLDQLNGIEEVAAINLSDLAQAMPLVAQSADKYNMSAAQLAATLAGMVEQGVGATEGATALKFALQRMYNPTEKAHDALLSLNVNPFDELTGQAKDATSLLQEVGEKLKSSEYTDEFKAHAIGDIFGSRQVDRIMAALKGMTSGTSDFADALRVAGEGQEALASRREQQIAALQQTPAFKFKQMKADLATFAADLGKFLIDPLLKLTNALLGVMKWLNGLSDPVKKTIAGFLLFGAILGPMVYVTSLIGEAFMTVGLGFAKVIPGLKIMSAEEALLAKQNKTVNTVIGQMDGLLMKLGETSVKTAETQAGAQEAVAAATETTKTAIEEAIAEISTAEQAHVAVIEEVTTATEANLAEQTAAYEAAAAAQIAAVESVAAAEILAAEERAAARRGEVLTATHLPVRGAGGRYARNPDMYTPIVPPRVSSTTSGTTPIPLGPAGSTGNGIAGTVAASSAGAGAGLEVLPAAEGAFAGTAAAAAETGEVASKGFFARFGGGLKKLFSAGGIGSLLSSAWGAIAGAFGEAGIIGGSAFAEAFGMTGVGTVIVAIIAAVAFLVVGIIRNWDKVKKGFAGTWNFIKDQWAELADAFAPVGEQFKKVWDLLSSATSGEGGGGFWTFLGKAFGFIVDIVGVAIRVIAEFIRALSWVGDAVGGFVPIIGFFFHFGDLISGVFKGLAEAIHGHWGLAMTYVLQGTWWMVKPVLRAFEALYDGVLEAIQGILLTIRNFVSVMPRSILGVSTGVGELVDVLDRAGDSIQGWQDLDLTRNVESLMDRLPDDPGAHDAAKNAGEEFGHAIADGVGDGVNDGGGEVAEDISKWMGDWLSAVKSRLDEAINRLKDQAKKALQVRFDANLKVYDDRIAAIDAVTKAEELALARKKYIESRRKLIEERAVQHENYMRDRALAIYEGRIDDARMLDLEEQKNKRDGNRSLQDLDEERRRTLVQQERDHQKEMLGIQRDALDERQKMMMEAFEAQLDLITQYAPRTIGEFQSMLNNMTNLLGEYGINMWPGMMQTGMGLFQQVIRDANERVVQDAAWSGNNAATAWLAAFITGDAKAAILAGTTDPTSEIGASGRGGLGYLPAATFARNPDAGVGASHYNRSFHTGGFLGAGPAADIPITAQTGEYMIQRKAVQKHGLPFLHAINSGEDFYHTGGLVQPRGPSSMRGTHLGDKTSDTLSRWVTDISDRWMQQRFDDPNRSTGWTIAGFDPARAAAAFQASYMQIGGQNYADMMPSFMAGDGEPIQQFANWINATYPGMHAGTGIGTHDYYVKGTHRVSLHTLKRAVDVSGSIIGMANFFESMLGYGRSGAIPIQELIYQHMGWWGHDPMGTYSKNDHFDHVHVGLRDGFANMMSNFGVSPTFVNGPTPGSLALKNYVRGESAKKFGDQHWGALDQLISHESSWDPFKENPTSSAADLFQFLDSTRRNYGIRLHDTIPNQTRTGLQYIQDVYNNPTGAWSAWLSRSPNWYHQGGYVTPNGAVAMAMGGMVPFDNYPALLHKGEAVMPKPLTDKIQNAGECHHGGDTIININADTFVGEFEHFKKQMKQYEIEVVPKQDRVKGKVNRRISRR